MRQKPRKGHRRGFDPLRRQTNFCDDRKRDHSSEGSSYDREWEWAALRRKSCRKSLEVAGQRGVKEEYSLPSEVQIPSLVLILTCAGRLTSEFHQDKDISPFCIV